MGAPGSKKHARKATLQLKRAEIARARSESMGGSEGENSEEEGAPPSSRAAAAARRRERKQAMAGGGRRRRRLSLQAEIEEGSEDSEGAEGSDGGEGAEGEDPMGGANFNRDYEGSASQAPAVGRGHSPSRSGVLSDPEAGFLSEDAEEPEEIGEEELRAFAFKSAAAESAAAGQDFEYELPEVAERLGSRLKLLTAGFDEAVMHVPHMKPHASTYSAYSLGSGGYGQRYYGDYDGGGGGVGPNGTRRPSLHSIYLEPSLYGSEYRPAPSVMTEEEVKLEKAAAQRRRRKIMRELHWQKQKAAAKALEREAQRKKEEADRERSRSGHSASRRSLTGGRRASVGGGHLSGAATPKRGGRNLADSKAALMRSRQSMGASAAASPVRY